MIEIMIRKNRSGFSKIYVGDTHIGTLEDVGDQDSASTVLKRLIKKLDRALVEQVQINEQFEG